MKKILILILIFQPLQMSAQTYVINTPKYLLYQSDLIALVNVGEIHTVRTPEGFVLQSASAKLLDIAWRTPNPIEPKEPDSIVIFTLGMEMPVITESVLKEGKEVYGPNIGPFEKMISFFKINPGKSLVCLKRRWLNTYQVLDEPLSFQPLDKNGKILWSTGKMPYTEVYPSKALDDIKTLIKSEPRKKATP